MISARAFLAWLSFSVLLLAADQPSLRAVVSDLRAQQAQSPSTEQVAARWARARRTLLDNRISLEVTQASQPVNLTDLTKLWGLTLKGTSP